MNQKSDSTNSKPSIDKSSSLRVDMGAKTSTELWLTLSQTPGIGVSITDSRGLLLFVNCTTAALFSGDASIDCRGKSISDFHPPEFVAERLALIRRVLSENRPFSISHIYHGRFINSVIWPIQDRKAPHNRVLVVSRPGPTMQLDSLLPSSIETVSTNYIDLGPLDVLTQRELEVAVLIGHGLSVPSTAQVLHRSPKTVERHKEAIAKKLSMHSQSQLVQAITTMGLELKDVALQRYDMANGVR